MVDYDSYSKQVVGRVKFKLFFNKFKALFISLGAVAIGGTTFFGVATGNFTEAPSFDKESYIYGETINMSKAQALFKSNVSYIYTDTENENNVFDKMPTMPGTYSVQAVSTGLFGNKKYSDKTIFEIQPKTISVTINENVIEFGKYPTVSSAELSNGDRITDPSYELVVSENAESIVGTYTLKSYKVFNSSNEDVTKLYYSEEISKDITYKLNGTKIIIEPFIEDKEYTGNTYTYNKEIKEVNKTYYTKNISIDFNFLINGKENEIMKNYSSNGYLISLKDFNITYEDIDVTKLFNVDQSHTQTTFNITKKNLNVNVSYNFGTGYLEYTGSAIPTSSFVNVSYSGLVSNDSLTYAIKFKDKNNTELDEVKEAGTLYKATISNILVNNSSADTNNYNIIKNDIPTFDIVAKVLKVKLNSLVSYYTGSSYVVDKKAYEFVGENYGFTDLEITEVSFFDLSFDLSNNPVVSAINSGDYIIKVKSTNFSSLENNEAYKIEFVEGSLTIKPAELKVTLSGNEEVTYTGKAQKVFDDSAKYTVTEIESKGNIKALDEFTVKFEYKYNNEVVSPINAHNYKVTYNGDFLVNGVINNNYVLTLEEDKILTINKASLNITLNDIDNITYDGLSHTPYQVIQGNIKNYSTCGLVNNDQFKVEVTYDSEAINVGTYTYSLSKVIFTSGSIDNYELAPISDKTFDIIKKDVYLKYSGLSKTFDNTDNVTLNGNTNLTTGLVGSDSIQVTKVNNTNMIYAGKYNIIPVEYQFVTGNSNNYNVIPTEVTNGYTINKKDVTIVIEDSSLDEINYTGNPYSYTKPSSLVYDEGEIYNESTFVYNVSFKKVNSNDDPVATITDVYDDGYKLVCTYELDDVDAKDSYNITLNVSNKIIYIKPYAIKIKAKGITKSYDGLTYTKDSSFEVEVVEGELSNTAKIIIDEVEIKSNNKVVNALNNGTYSVKITKYHFENSEDSKAYAVSILTNETGLVINPIELSFDIKDRESVTYDGLSKSTFEHVINYEIREGVFEDIYITYKYIDENSNEVNPKHASTYRMVYTSHLTKLDNVNTDSSNFVLNSNQSYKEFTINKKDITVTFNKQTKVFDNSEDFPSTMFDKTNTVVSGLVNGENLWVSSASISGNYKYVGTYSLTDIVLTFASNTLESDYNVSYSEGSDDFKYEITKREVTVKLNNTGLTNLTYNGNEFEYSKGTLVYGTNSLTIPDALTMTYDVKFKNNANQSLSSKIKDVGNYTLVCNTYSILDGQYELTPNNIEVTFIGDEVTISPKILSINFTNLSKTYDGISNTGLTYEINGLVDGDSVTITFDFTSDKLGQNVLSDVKNVGEYYIKVKEFTDTSNNYYFDSSAYYCKDEYIFSINPIEIKVTLNKINDFTYEDGTTLSDTLGFEYVDASVILLEDLSNISVELTAKYLSGNNIMALPVSSWNAGTYSYKIDSSVVKLNDVATSNYVIKNTEVKEFTINKRSVVKPQADQTVFTYTGSEQNYNVIDNDLVNSALYTVSNNKNTNAGSYKVKIELNNENYMWSDNNSSDYFEYTFTINKATVVKPTAESNQKFEYDGLEHSMVISDSEDKALYTITGNSGTSAKTYTVDVKLKDSSNYKWVEGNDFTFSFEITKKEVTKPQADQTVFTYTGSEQTYNVIDNDLVNSALYTVSNNKNTNAGSYKVKIELNNENYMWSDNNSSDYFEYDFIINKATVVKPTAESNQKFEYDELEHSMVISDSEDKTLYTITGNSGTSAKTYTVDVKLKDSSNYKWVEGNDFTFSFEITKKEVVKPTADETEFIYNGSDKTYYIEESTLYTVSNNTKKNAGEYKVSVELKDSNNYKWKDSNTTTIEYDFIIEKKEATITLLNKEFTYDSNTQILTDFYSTVGIIDADLNNNFDIKYTVNDDKTLKDAGTYTYTIDADKSTIGKGKSQLKLSDNYDITINNNNAEVIIKKADLTISFNVPNKTFDDKDYEFSGTYGTNILVNKSYNITNIIVVSSKIIYKDSSSNVVTPHYVGTYTFDSISEGGITLTGDKLDNFNITYSGTITIDKVNIIVDLASNQWGSQIIYTGNELEYNKTLVNAKLVSSSGGQIQYTDINNKYGDIDIKFDNFKFNSGTTILNAGTYTITYDVSFTKNNNSNISYSNNFNISGTINNQFTIEKSVLLYQTKSVSKKYDGTNLIVKQSDLDIKLDSSIKSGFSIVVANYDLDEYFVSDGYKDIIPIVQVKDESNNDVTDNFILRDSNPNISLGDGTIRVNYEITKGELTIALSSVNQEKVYDGISLSIDDIDYSISGKATTDIIDLQLAIEDGKGGYYNTLYNVGTYTYSIDLDASTVNTVYALNDLYDVNDISSLTGTFTITKKDASIYIKEIVDKEYDNKDVWDLSLTNNSNPNSKYTVSGLVDGDYVRIALDYYEEDAGHVTNGKNVGSYTYSVSLSNSGIFNNHTTYPDDVSKAFNNYNFTITYEDENKNYVISKREYTIQIINNSFNVDYIGQSYILENVSGLSLVIKNDSQNLVTSIDGWQITDELTGETITFTFDYLYKAPGSSTYKKVSNILRAGEYKCYLVENGVNLANYKFDLVNNKQKPIDEDILETNHTNDSYEILYTVNIVNLEISIDQSLLVVGLLETYDANELLGNDEILIIIAYTDGTIANTDFITLINNGSLDTTNSYNITYSLEE